MMPKGKGNNINRTAVSSSSSSSAPHPQWIELPCDLTLNIFRRLWQEEIMSNVQNVCTTWRNVCFEPSLWQVIDVYFLDEMIIRDAVDRSQGELIDIKISLSGTDELLQHISDRSSHLKRLTIEFCSLISPRGLMTSIKTFPCLEELHLHFLRSGFDVDMETIGISCPLLKSFSFNKLNYKIRGAIINNSGAFLIARTMPNLCSLGLVGHRLDNEGLQAILDGCPNLESLDLQMCFNVDLDSEFGRRCSERIKVLKCSGKDTPFLDECDVEMHYDEEEDDHD